MAATRKLTTGAVVDGDTWVDLVDAEVEGVWLNTINRLTGTAGSSLAYTATGTPDFVAGTLAYGTVVVFVPHVTCGASPTLNIDGQGVFEIKKPDGSANGANPAAGDLVANNPYTLEFRSTYFMLISTVGSAYDAATSAEFDALLADHNALETEVVNARSGQANLDTRIDNVVRDTINAQVESPTIHGESKFVYTDGADSSLLKKVDFDVLAGATMTYLGGAINALPAKAAPLGSDDFVISDSAASNAPKKLLWSSLLTDIRNVYGPTIIAGMTAKAAPTAGDDFVIADGDATNATKKVSWAALKADVAASLPSDSELAALQAEHDALEAEVVTARSGKASLDARVDTVVVDSINAAPDDPAITDTSKLTYTDAGDGFLLKSMTWAGARSTILGAMGGTIAALTAKTTSLLGSDDFIISDSEASNVAKRLTWSDFMVRIREIIGPSTISGASAKGTIAAGDDFVIADSAAANATASVSWGTMLANVFTSMGPTIQVTTAKATLVDADDFVISDSEATNATKKVSWSSIHAGIEARFGGVIAAAPAKLTLLGSDDFLISDSAASNARARITWATLLENVQNVFGPSLIGTADYKDTTLHGGDDFVISDQQAAHATKKVAWTTMLSSLSASLGVSLIHPAAVKAALADGDDFAISDGADAHATKQVSWAVMKSSLQSTFASQGEMDALEADMAALEGRMDVGEALHDSGLDARPGDRPDLFTETLLGAYEDTPIISGIPVVVDTDGTILRVTAAHKVAARQPFRIEPGHAYKVRGIVRRRINATDPSNDAIAFKIQWLNSSQVGGVGTTVVFNENELTTASGRTEWLAIAALTAGAGIDIVAPAGAVYGRPYIETFGLATTDVEVVEVTDITEAEIVDTGDAALASRVTALESEELPERVEALETSTTGIGVSRYDTRPAAVAAAAAGSIPSSTDLTEALSGAAAGDGMHRQYLRSVASSGPDWFPDLDGSFWVHAPQKIIAESSFAARSLDRRAYEIPHVEDWRGFGGDSSDTGTLQAAIDNVVGGMLRLPQLLLTEAQVNVNRPGISLIGHGWGEHVPYTTPQGFPCSQIVWDGGTPTPGMAMLRVVPNTLGTYMTDFRIDNVFISGGNVALKGLWLTSGRHCYIGRIYVERFVETGILLDDGWDGGGHSFTSIDRAYIASGQNAACINMDGIVLRQNGGAGLTGFYFDYVYAVVQNGDAMSIGNIDNMLINKAACGSAGVGLRFRGLTDGQLVVSRKNFINQYSGHRIYAEAGSRNAIDWINSEGSSITIEPGGVLHYKVIDRVNGRRWTSFAYDINIKHNLPLSDGYLATGSPALVVAHATTKTRVLAFDAATLETWAWTVPPLRNFSGGRITGIKGTGVKSSGTNAGDVCIRVGVHGKALNSTLGGSMTEFTYTHAVDPIGTSTIEQFEITFGTPFILSFDWHLVVHFSRNGADVTDTYPDDWYLLGLQFLYEADVANSDAGGTYRYDDCPDANTYA